MGKRINKNWLLIFTLIAFVLTTGSGNCEEKKNNAKNAPAITNQVKAKAPATKAASAADDIAISVDGNILKESEIEKAFKNQLKILKADKIPAEKIELARTNLRKQMVNEFIMRTLISNEVERRKIKATDKEIEATMDLIKADLPPGTKLETFMKENKITREHIVLDVKAKKMVKQELGKNVKPSQEEISKFYEENKSKFTNPENVHVRHILVAFAAEDDDKAKEEKKVKIENLRKQIIDGADFAEIARNNSDCPSKAKDGDLGAIRKGQTVKPFEEAAFSQEINVVGPVVTTEYGHHIIQVLEHNPAKVISLEEVKDKISSHLEQQKELDAFGVLFKKLREKAKIIYHEN